MTYHRNPIVNRRLGVSLHETAALDWLHTLSLGIFQSSIGALVNLLIVLNAWNVPGPAAVRRAISIDRLQSDLFAFYTAQAKLGVQLSRVQRLDPGMFGSAAKPDCKLHGGETNGLLFCLP